MQIISVITEAIESVSVNSWCLFYQSNSIRFVDVSELLTQDLVVIIVSASVVTSRVFLLKQ